MIYLFAIALAVVVNVFSWEMPFFWDTILTSTITQYFYENGFHNFITPSAFDAGHPPLFYFYVTCFYHLFGKSLFAAHLSMLPFSMLGILSFIKILQHFQFTKKMQFFGLILFFSIPAIITQYCLVSYDAVLLSLYLAALLSVLKNKKVLFAFILIGLVGISLRGLFCMVSLSITIYFLEYRNINSWFKWNLYFVPAVTVIISWFVFHYIQTGWFLSTNAAGWSGQRGFVNLFRLFKNGFSIARCFFDLGIAFILLLGIFYYIQKRRLDNFTLLWLIPAIVFSVLFLPFTNPVNHRYFLIVYALMLLPVLKFLSDKRSIYSILTMFILISGHFLIYPAPISNGWDCTMVHTTYNKKVRNEFYHTITGRLNLDRTKIGTVFPMNVSKKQTDMSDDTIRMLNVNGKSIDSIAYVLYSNIGNDFSDEQINQLKKWIVVMDYRRAQVEMILYKNPEYIQK